MALQIDVPPDLLELEPKVAFGLTKRQLICFGGGALCGLPLFFLLKGVIGSSAASMLMMAAMSPWFLMAMYKKNGLHLEQIIQLYYQYRFVRPRKRPYISENVYDLIDQQIQINKEVHAIVQEAKRRGAVHQSGKKKAQRAAHPRRKG